jgi:alpha-1,2-mannosyltransferase
MIDVITQSIHNVEVVKHLTVYLVMLSIGIIVLLQIKLTQDSNASQPKMFGLDRPTYLLGIALYLSTVLPLLTVPVCGWACATRGFHIVFESILSRGAALDDSWTPIEDALRYLASNSPKGLYQSTYWHSDRQFLYSPLSIVFYRLTNFPPVLDWFSPESLNKVSWILLLVNIILVVIIFNVYNDIFNINKKPVNLRERIARICIPLVAGILYFPLVVGYSAGNIQTWLTFLIILSLLLWLCGYRWGVGVCLGTVCLFKPVFVPVLLWALLRREFSVVVGFLSILIPFGVTSLMMFGFGVHWEYLDLMLYLSGRGESSFISHSVNSLLNRAIFNGPNLELDFTHSHIKYVAWIHYATIATTLCAIGTALIGRRQSCPVASWMDYATALLSCTIAASVVYEHHLGFTVVLFMVTGVVLCQRSHTSHLMLWMLAISYAAMTNFLEVSNALANTYFNFLQSYRLFSSLVLLIILCRLRAGAPEPTVSVLASAQTH